MGWTPLFWAAFQGNLATVRMLLHGSDDMVPDVNGWTALKWAMAREQVEVAQVLLKHHGDCLHKLVKQPRAFLKDFNFRQVRQYWRKNDILRDMLATYPEGSRWKDTYKELGALLLDSGMGLADLDHLWPSGHFDEPIGNFWETKIKGEHYNGSHSYGSGLDRYIEERRERPSPEPRKEWKARLLQSAIRDDSLQAVRLLLELGADVNYRFHEFRPALFAAACRKNPSYARILLEHGANPNIQDHKRHTPLQLAVTNVFEETSAALVRGGADVDAKCDELLVTVSA